MRAVFRRLASALAGPRRPSARPVLAEPDGSAPLVAVMRAPHH
ncbi:hypothetical protein [Streptomyces sp. NPDC058157]